MIRLQLHSIAETMDAADPRTSVLTPVRSEPQKEATRRAPKAAEFAEDVVGLPGPKICACGRRKRSFARMCVACAHAVFMEDRSA